MYKTGAICGKFRIVHHAHRELIFVAAQKVQKLNIFVCDEKNINRIMPLEKTIKVLSEIAKKAKIEYKIHVLSSEELNQADTDHKWDQLLLSKDNQLEVVFDSKEAYGNVILNNEYINLPLASKNMSVTKIEADLFALDNFYLISPEAIKILKVSINIVNFNLENKTTELNLSNCFGLPETSKIFSINQNEIGDISVEIKKADSIIDILKGLRNVSY
jgi:hypothetical protein